MQGAEVGKGQETKEGARWKGAMSRARKDRFIVQRAAASGTGGAGAGRVVGGLGVGGGSELGLGTGTVTRTGSARSLSLAPSQRMSASARVRVCVKELADANGNANENANGNANGNGTSTMIGVGGWVCAWAWATRTRAWDLRLGTWDLGTWGLGDMGAAAEDLDSPRLDSTFSASYQLSRSLISLPRSPRPPGPRSSSRARAPGQGTAATHKVQSRYLTIPLAARQPAKYRPRSHLANDGTTQPATACWAQHACLVLSCLVGAGAIAVPRYCTAAVVSWSSGP